jgi:hypothetical protein
MTGYKLKRAILVVGLMFPWLFLAHRASAAVPIPRTPCAAEVNGKPVHEHHRYWRVDRGWVYLTGPTVGWVSSEGLGCYL